MTNLKPARTSLAGLCTSCNRAGDCMYLTLPRSPVWHCEEFDDRLRPRSGLCAPIEPTPRAPTTTPGLCFNCAERPHCTLPRPEGGVWHCEEYR